MWIQVSKARTTIASCRESGDPAPRGGVVAPAQCPPSVRIDGTAPQLENVGERGVGEIVDQGGGPRFDVGLVDGHGGVAHELREEALLRRHVHDEVADAQPVGSCRREGVVGNDLDRLGKPLGRGEIEIDDRISLARSTRPSGREHLVAQRRGRRERFGSPHPRRGVGQPRGLGGEIGPPREHRGDRRGFVGFAGVERIRAEQLLDGFVRELERSAHHESPSAWSASAILRSPRRSRDFAVPSGIPSFSAT